MTTGEETMEKMTMRGFRAMARILIAPAILLMSACATADSCGPPGDLERPAGEFIVVGHRGAAGLSPENTLAAFRKACETGVDAMELDIRFTADGALVVHHDSRLRPDTARTPDGAWVGRPAPAVKDLPLAELKTYDVGRLKPFTRRSMRHPDQRPADGERIPTLGEVIALLKAECEPAVQLWIEIKTSPEKPDLTPPPERAADAIIAMVREETIAERVRILSFDWRALARVQEIAPHVPTVYLSRVGVRLDNIQPGRPGASPWMAGLDIDDFKGSIPRAVKAAGGRHWAPHSRYITWRLLEEAHALGLGVFIWTVDSCDEMKRLMAMGVDGIITNRPDRLRSLVTEKEKGQGTEGQPNGHHE